MSGITTHVLDTSRGAPAGGVRVRLEVNDTGDWREIGNGATDADGRLKTLLPQDAALLAAFYRLTFDTGEYFRQRGVDTFYPSVVVTFQISATGQHYHVPLLVSPFGYSTYRGS
jgi:5-hydroxyisourate hydrolase